MKNIRKAFHRNKVFSCFTLIYVVLIILPLVAQDIEVQDGWFYLDGKKFFVKGIGYGTSNRPGQYPWYGVGVFDAPVLQSDLNRIKEAGYNTIRTWGALTEAELQIINASGLKVIFGIWINQNGDYGDATFIAESKSYVNSILNYSNKYPCIIAYLIMNEPLAEDIYRGGASELVHLWQELITIIHNKHPGIPVSISATEVNDFVRTDHFGIAAYNLYVWGCPMTLYSRHGYAEHVHFYKMNRAADMPLVVTEFGLSVSPTVSDHMYGYGGNSLQQQAEGDIMMYRGLIDGGAQGGCVFHHQDEWWKGGNADVHDPVVEEWFGLIHFDDPSAGKAGTTRPAWNAFSVYNRAIITSPKNGRMYTGTIPLELFLMDEVKRLIVSRDQTELLDETVSSTYVQDEICFSVTDEIEDVVLDFRFYDSTDQMIKEESITILCSQTVVTMPSVEITLTPDEVHTGGSQFMVVKITRSSDFEIENNRIDYWFHPHINFGPGVFKTKTFTSDNNIWLHTDSFTIPPECIVASFWAGITIRYGNFRCYLTDQKTVFKGNWADAIKAFEDQSTYVEIFKKDVVDEKKARFLSNVPNPFNGSTEVSYVLSAPAEIRLTVYDLNGRQVEMLYMGRQTAGSHQAVWKPQNQASGVYICRIDVLAEDEAAGPSNIAFRKLLYVK